ncbi:ornithine carbamoyltransferase, partial [bacterium B13(2017)]
SNLKNKTFGLLFNKSSTRTRVSFEVGISDLGGRSLFLSPDEIQLGRGETIEDTAKVLSRYLDGVVIRTYAHSDILKFANNSTIPVINGLTDLCHPCQVLADLYTINEKKGTYKGKRIVYLGDCDNNMAYSWIMGAASLGYNLVLSGCDKYMPKKSLIKKTKIEIIKDPKKAVRFADVIYTDVWTSMGYEAESRKRKRLLKPWQVNHNLLKLAKKDVIFMHCLPAHRGEEVTSDVIDGEQSVVFDQAENRLHVQKAILVKLFS